MKWHVKPAGTPQGHIDCEMYLFKYLHTVKPAAPASGLAPSCTNEDFQVFMSIHGHGTQLKTPISSLNALLRGK